jgi:imidazolonepropionase-like amidohydrolase
MSTAMKTLCALTALTISSLSGETRVLSNVTLIDGTGKPAQPGMSIEITDGKITRIVKGKLDAPAGAQTTDLSGKYVMPGIINLHGHLGNVKGLVQDARNYTRQNLEEQLRTYAAYGVTTVVSMGSDNDVAFKVRAEQRSGRPKYTRIYTAGRGFTGKNGYPTAAPGMKGIPYEVETAAQVKQAVSELKANNVDLVKIWVDDHFGKDVKIPMDLSAEIIKEAHGAGKKVAAHIFYLDDAKKLVDAGLDALAHSVRDKLVDDALIASMKKRGAWQLATTFTREVSAYAFATPPAWLDDPFLGRSVSPDVIKTLKTPGQKAVPSDPRFGDGLAIAKKNLKRLVDAGVKHGFGTDTGPPGRFQGYFEHMEMQLMAEAGLTPMQIIQAATRNSAEFLQAKDLGTLEAGKWADLVVLNANPVSSIGNTRSIHSVMIAGNPVASLAKASNSGGGK